MGCCGYLQIGLLPELNSDQEPVFNVRAVIALGETYIPFDIEEIANFFISIRQHADFIDLPGGEEYFPFVQNEFMGNFFAKTDGPVYIFSYVNYENGSSYELAIPNKELVEHILSLEHIVNGHMNILCVLHDNQQKLMQKLEELRLKCFNSPTHVKQLAEFSSDKFVTEMATNLFSFFAQYWYIKNQ